MLMSRPWDLQVRSLIVVPQRCRCRCGVLWSCPSDLSSSFLHGVGVDVASFRVAGTISDRRSSTASLLSFSELIIGIGLVPGSDLSSSSGAVRKKPDPDSVNDIENDIWNS